MESPRVAAEGLPWAEDFISHLAYSDQVLCVALVAVAPDLLTSAMLFMLAIAASTAVAFSRRVRPPAQAPGLRLHGGAPPTR